MLQDNAEEKKTSLKSRVVVAGCRSYNKNEVDPVTESILSQFEIWNTLTSDKTVLIKPNLLSPSKTPDQHVNTHPHVVRSLVKFLRQKTSATILIGESSSSFNPRGTSEAFKNSGLLALAREFNVYIVNFDREPVIKKKIPDGSIYKTLEIAEVLEYVDCIISVPKLKTHELCLMTGAVKNMMGVLPGKRKKDAHSQAVSFKRFSDFIVDLYSIAKPHFAFMDAIIAMEGDGPSAGGLVRTGFLAASSDAVSLDAAICRLTGIPVDDVLYLKKAQNSLLGVFDHDRTYVIRGNTTILHDRKLVIPERFYTELLLRFLPRRIKRGVLEKIIYQKPQVIQKKCIGCLQCFHACPANCIVLDADKKVTIDKKRCQECYCCHEVCPAEAIVLKKHFLGRLMNRVLLRVRQVLR